MRKCRGTRRISLLIYNQILVWEAHGQLDLFIFTSKTLLSVFISLKLMKIFNFTFMMSSLIVMISSGWFPLSNFHKYSNYISNIHVLSFSQNWWLVTFFLFEVEINFVKLLSFPDPFAVSTGNEDSQGLVHIRIQQRNGRKTLTTVQGLSASYDLKKIVRTCKKVRLLWVHRDESEIWWFFFVGICLQRNSHRTSRVRRSFTVTRWSTWEYLPILNKDGIGETRTTQSSRFLNFSWKLIIISLICAIHHLLKLHNLRSKQQLEIE